MSLFSRLRTEIRDRLYYSLRLRGYAARVLRTRTPRVGPASEVGEILASIHHLCRIARAQQGRAREKTEDEIGRRVALTVGKPIDWGAITPGWNPNRIENGVVLKPYLGEREKGVVLIAFERHWTRLMAIPNLRDFAGRYTLVIAPSSTPPHSLGMTLFPAHYPDDCIFSFMSNRQEIAILPRLSSKIRVIPLYASNWVDPNICEPVPLKQKDFDIAMVAGFGRVKRHFALFRALREMPRNIRVLLVGQPMDGRTAADLMEEARLYGVQDRFELKDSVSHPEALQSLARARISLILSKQEGASVAVVESMFADTPVGIFHDAVIGSSVFINDQTGCLLRHEHLAKQLMNFVASAERYSPRGWAIANDISCYGSTRVLNQALQDEALASGRQWTRDIAVHCSRMSPFLLPEFVEPLRPEYESIRARYGIAFGKPA